MGNAESVPDRDDPAERVPLAPIGTRVAFQMGVATPSPSRTRSRSNRLSSRKRPRTPSHASGTDQPAGCDSIDRPSQIRDDVLSAQGVLEYEDNIDVGGANVVYWTIDTRKYHPSESGLLPRRIASSQFRIHTIGSRLLWQLALAPMDCRSDSIWLYLESVNGRSGEPFTLESRFALAMGSSDSRQRLHSQSIEHCFSDQSPLCGITSHASLNSVLEWIARDGPYITIRLDFNWIRDSRLFPPQFLEISSDRPELYLISESPKIFLVERFLTMDECEMLIEMATPHLYRSRVSSGTETTSRTSSSMFFTGKLSRLPVVKDVETKLRELVDRPDINEGRVLIPNESLQAVRYHVGEFYAEHYDVRVGQAHLRAATLIVYLRDTHAGGATYFPLASDQLSKSESLTGWTSQERDRRRDGLRVYPRCGRAILFWSRLPSGQEDKASIHAAEPVIAGEKWIATRWLREEDTE